jgi:hypothetical protein
MNQSIDPAAYGYTRALWLFPGKHWMRPDSASVVSEEDAIAEIREALGEEDGK